LQHRRGDERYQSAEEKDEARLDELNDRSRALNCEFTLDSRAMAHKG
jgi:hypothetical protein